MNLAGEATVTVGSSSWYELSEELFVCEQGGVVASSATINLPLNFEEVFGKALGDALIKALDSGDTSVCLSSDNSTKVETTAKDVFPHIFGDKKQLEAAMTSLNKTAQANLAFVWNHIRCIIPRTKGDGMGMTDKIFLDDVDHNGIKGQRYGVKTYLAAGRAKNPSVPGKSNAFGVGERITPEIREAAVTNYSKVFGAGKGSEMIHDAVCLFLEQQGEVAQHDLYWRVASTWQVVGAPLFTKLHSLVRDGKKEVPEGSVPDKQVMLDSKKKPIRGKKKGTVMAHRIVPDTPGLARGLDPGSCFYSKEETKLLRALESHAKMTLSADEAKLVKRKELDRSVVLAFVESFDREMLRRKKILEKVSVFCKKRKDGVVLATKEVAKENSEEFSKAFEELAKQFHDKVDAELSTLIVQATKELGPRSGVYEL